MSASVGTSSSTHWTTLTLDEERIAAAANPCPPGAATCKGKLHIAVFFDGILLNEIDTTLPPSNIGRLYRAFPKEALGSTLRRAIYIPGVGTDLDLSRFEFSKERALAVATEIRKGTIDKNTVGRATGAPKGIGKDLAREVLVNGKKIGEAAEAAVRGYPSKMGKEALEAVKNPWKTVKGAIKDALGEIALSAIDMIDPLRDSKFLFELVNAGVEPRLSEAMRQFETMVTDTQMKIEEIQVSVYGGDWGGALARAFLNKLCEKCEGDESSDSLSWTLKDKTKVPLNMMFAGMFDAVGYRDNATVGFLAENIPMLRNKVATKQELPRALSHGAHFIAAHELRWRAHTLGGAELVKVDEPVFPAKARQERIYPGTGRDVIGAYQPGQEQRSQDLGNIALQEMWRIARVSGVPYDGIDATRALAGKYGEAFNLEATRRARYLLSVYDNTAVRLSDRLLGVSHASAAVSDMGGEQTHARTMLAHRMLHVVWLRSLLDRARNEGRLAAHLHASAIQAAIDFGRIHLMMTAVGRETFYGSPIFKADNYHRTCAEVAGLDPLPRIPPGAEELFSLHMHDPVYPPDDEYAIQRLPSTTRLLRARYLDKGDDTREPTFTERLGKAWEATVQDLGKYPPGTINPGMGGIPF